MAEKLTKYDVIALFLYDYARVLCLREIARLLSRPHQSIKPHAESLVAEGILKKQKRKKITDYFLNFSNPLIYDYLVIAEKQQLHKRLGRDAYFSALFENLSVFFAKSLFILFGSAVADAKKASDIDLLIVGEKEAEIAVKNFQKLYGKRIHAITAVDMGKITETLAREIHKKHLILSNTEQAVRHFVMLYENNKLVQKSKEWHQAV